MALAQRPPEPDSLAPNPSFERGANGEPEGWSFYSWEGAEGWWDDSVARSGSRSLGLKGLNGGWSANLDVQPGVVYNLRFHYRAEGGPSQAVVSVREVVDGRVGDSILYKPLVTLQAGERGAFVEGTDEKGWAPFEGGDFIPRAGVTAVSLLIKIHSQSPDARLCLDDIAVTSRQFREAPATARRLANLAEGILWTDLVDCKIMSDQLPPEGRTEPSLVLSAAGGEYECFQVAITPSRTLPQVSWVWEGLRGPAEIPAGAMTCRLIECIPIDRPRGPYGQAGLHPDALTDRLPADLVPGATHGFWFGLKVPADQPPGEYGAELSLHSQGRELAKLPLTLTVRGFSIPSRPSLDVQSSFRYELVLARESGDPREVLPRYYRSYFEHRTRCAPAAQPIVRVRGDEVELDLDEYVSHVRLLRDRHGLRRLFLASLWIGHGETHRMPADARWQGRRIFADEQLTRLAPEFERPFRAYFGGLCARLKQEGVFLDPVVRFFDEPHLDDPPTLNGLRTLSKLLLDIEPDVKVAIAASDPHPGLTDAIRVWALHTDAWDRALPHIQAAREAGCEIQVYNNAINLPDYRRLRVRLWPWLLWKYGVDGTFSWWGTVCWRGELADPWTAGGGDFSGVMLYPPRTADEHGPIESVRWELFREGLEDYEYLALADRLASALEDAGKPHSAQVGRKAIERAMGLVERWPNVRAANDEPHTIDPTLVEAARSALAEAIETMQETLGD